MLEDVIVKDRQATDIEKRQEMSVSKKNDSIVAVLNTYIEAKKAVGELQKAGFDMKKLSILGRDYAWIICALQGATVVDGLSAVGAALYGIGISRDSILKYGTSLKSNKFLVVAHGTTEEIDWARDILQGTEWARAEVHCGETSQIETQVA
jgi:predicted sugar kinase